MIEKEGDGGGERGWSIKDNINENNGDGDCEMMRSRKNEAEKLREMQLSIAASASVFPGFRFSPTDDELISYYLKKKLQGSDNSVDIIPEVDFCRHEPWDLPAISIIRSDNEWFFFSARGKKYPNGSQSRRATQSGYWKATGKERNVKSGPVTIGTKRTLVFHTGRAPKGERTEWIMHEYCMSDTTQESLVVCRLRRNGDFRLNESSTRGSSDRRSLSAADDGKLATNEYAHAQIDAFDGGNAIKSCSKESTSSYRSHSVELNDSGSESELQLIHESPRGSSSRHKGCDNEDDCFADIINDDIIKLDESASHSPIVHGVLTADVQCIQKLQHETMSSVALSGQGTAVRRIKLRHPNGQIQHEKPSSGLNSNDTKQDQPSQNKSSGCVLTVLADTANAATGYRWLYPILVLLTLLTLVAWQGYNLPPCFKQHPDCTWLEVSKMQLRRWLHKAANHL